MPNLSGYKQLFANNILTVDSSDIEGVGTRAVDDSGNEYIYLQGTASVVAKDWVVYDEGFTTTRLTANEVGPVAIAGTAIVLGQYGWFQVYGVAQGNSDTISADSSLYIDGTAGRVDDLSVSGDLVLGAYSMTDAVSNVATVFITYPHVSNDVGGGAGTISGPAVSTDNAIVRWDGTGGGTLQNSSVTIDDSGYIFQQGSSGTARIDTVNLTADRTISWPNSSGTLYIIGGTDVAVADGGTGASSAADARTNLGLVIGTNVQAYDAQLADVAGLTPTASTFIVGDGSNFVSHSAALARGDLGLVIGTNVQAWDNDLDDLAALAHTTASAMIVTNGTDWVATGTTVVRSNLDLATTATPQFTKLGLGAAASGTAAALINLNTGGNIVVGDLNPKRTIVLSAAGGWAATSQGTSVAAAKFEMSTNKNNYQLMQFNPSATSYAEWTVAMPDNYDGDKVIAKFYWTLNDTTGSVVVWEIGAVSVADNESLDVAFGATGTAQDTHNAAAYKLNVSPNTGPVTIAGTPAGGELVQFRVKRAANVSPDTAATAYLASVKLEYGISSFSD